MRPVSFVATAALMLVAVPALAQRESEEKGTGTSEAPTEANTETTRAEATTETRIEDSAGAKEEKEEEEPVWKVNADVVVGSGTLGVLTAGPPGPREAAPANVFDSTRVTTTSFMLGLERRLGERFEVGVRMPLVYGTLASRNDLLENRNRFVAGNLELEGVYELVERKSFGLDIGLEVALPTGGGTEQPTEAEVAEAGAETPKRYAYASIERGAVNKAAEWTRGSYESALFEPDRIGIIPRIGARISAGNLTIRPALKVENLVDVTGDAPEGYIGELVVGVRAEYRLAVFLEPGVHVWTNITYTKHEERDVDVGLVSPYLRFILGRVRPEIGVILPFTGRLVSADAFGIRLAVTAAF